GRGPPWRPDPRPPGVRRRDAASAGAIVGIPTKLAARLVVRHRGARLTDVVDAGRAALGGEDGRARRGVDVDAGAAAGLLAGAGAVKPAVAEDDALHRRGAEDRALEGDHAPDGDGAVTARGDVERIVLEVRLAAP